ncbi:MAG: hypothetical protein EKK35_17875 [Bradyrhizobiaceae bacterium]|nr:MAG: hypothetical protein EKK35_17875 [Bradyrhizobiaceae bacterium]
MSMYRRAIFVLAMVFVCSTAHAQQADIEISALMKGRCQAAVANKSYNCKPVSYMITGNRALFTMALDDPEDDGRVLSFSGSRSDGEISPEKAYELKIDRMLLNSKDRPKVQGVPVPLIKQAKGKCSQTGDFARRQVQVISCTATDDQGIDYLLRFESDGSPISVVRSKDERLPTEASASKSFVGKWYAEKPDACRSKPGEQDNGLVVYSAKRFEGYESTCEITKVEPRANRFALTMKCSAEGETETVKENLELKDGKLVRLGRYTVTYTRCP